MTGAAIFALLWPLGRGRIDGFADVADAKSLYRAQLEEIERDLGAQADRGAGSGGCARRSGTPAAARGDDETGPSGETEPSLRRRRASSALMLSVVPLLALLVYGLYGSPGYPRPAAWRRGWRTPGRSRISRSSLARIEAHLAANPTDARGWVADRAGLSAAGAL